MGKKIYANILFLLLIVFSFVFAQSQNGKLTTVKKAALILKDTTKLEITVSRALRDSLTKSGYKVKETVLTDISKENAADYNVSIIFSAVKAGNEVDPRIQKFIAAKTDTASKIILYTVYGNIYDKQSENVDATTQATSALHPQIIANHILQSFKKQ